MESDHAEDATRIPASKRRIPKACNQCRSSKVKCDEQRPRCKRCKTLEKTCVYVEKPKSADEQKIEELQQEVVLLRHQLSEQARIYSGSFLHENSSRHQAQSNSFVRHSTEITSPQSVVSATHSSPSITSDRPLKRKKPHFQMQKEVEIPDFVSEGMLSEQQVFYYFDHFFQGCHRYVPMFDASDTLTSIRSRSNLLLNTICAVGCSISGDEFVDGRTLRVRLTRSLTTVVLSPSIHSLETVQALLIMACWWPEKSLLLAIATRMAMDLQLDDAFDRLVNLSLTSPSTGECRVLMRSARTLGLLWNLAQIIQIDAGNLAGLKVKGVRRCRTLLDKPFSVNLDARLFSQVELNNSRIKINKSLAAHNDDLLQVVQEARVDIAIWFDDWKRIIETSPLSHDELPSLMTNLTIQRHWADAMAACRAIGATGVNNIDMMSPDQRELLSLAQEALQRHLDVMLADPEYLANFKFAMDFVWAKCAFSYLLLLKLTHLLRQDSSQFLLEQGRALHKALSGSSGHGSSKVYLRLLQLTIDKSISREDAESVELEEFIPEEFVLEWDFPGLNLFSSRTGWDMLFDQYLLGNDFLSGING